MNAGESFRAWARRLSDRLVEIQRPIRILEAIRWDRRVEEEFLARGGRELPRVDRRSYAERPLPFDAGATRRSLRELARDVTRRLGPRGGVGDLLRRRCAELARVVRMLEARGTPEFARLSRALYGSASEVSRAGEPTLAELGAKLAASGGLADEEKTLDAARAAERMQERLDRTFPEAGRRVRVTISDAIAADAAAGSRTLRLRRDARFSERGLRALEAHEGWVHLGTSRNGLGQPVCTFLGAGSPSSTPTQEGLAILMERIAVAPHRDSLRRIANRVRAVALAESGADFRRVFEFFRAEGHGERDAYAHAVRVFRGSTPDGGPFTKDLCYARGFVRVASFARIAARRGRLDRLALLFCGKTRLEDVRVLAELAAEGVVLPPRFLPPPFADPDALSACGGWAASCLGPFACEGLEADYALLL
jgi:uncharacterized protein (TIGR02421 family)